MSCISVSLGDGLVAIWMMWSDSFGSVVMLRHHYPLNDLT